MNSACTIDLLDRGPTSQAPATGFWCESLERYPEKAFDLFRRAKVAGLAVSFAASSVTAISEPWLLEQRSRDAVVTIRTATNRMLIGDLGWSREQALETRMRLRTFEEDWNAPGMEAYDEL